MTIEGHEGFSFHKRFEEEPVTQDTFITTLLIYNRHILMVGNARVCFKTFGTMEVSTSAFINWL